MTDTSIREQRDLHVISDNHSLFSVYRSHLIPDLWKTTSGRSTLSILTKLEQYLGENEPTEQLARSFLLQYSTKKPSTQRLYSRVVEKFMNWYIQLPENTPRLHTQHSPKHAVSLLLQAIRAKKTHKSTIERDCIRL